MKKIAFIIIFFVISCSSNKASSPQELVENVIDNDIVKMSGFMKYIPEDEHPVVAFSYDFIAAFLIQFSSNEDIKKRYKDIRAKFKLPDTINISDEIDLKNPLTMIQFAQKNYNINCVAYVAEIEDFLNFADPQHAVSYDNVKIEELVYVKISGDTATGVVKYENGKTEEVTFVKINGVWYFSIKYSLLKRYIIK